jgi:hypothetical protein
MPPGVRKTANLPSVSFYRTGRLQAQTISNDKTGNPISAMDVLHSNSFTREKKSAFFLSKNHFIALLVGCLP